MDKTPTAKIVTVGDGAVGKTALLRSYISNEIDPAYKPTIFDTMNANTTYLGRPVSIQFYDSAGQEEYSHLRKLSYPNTGCFLLCFALNSISSFLNVTQHWVPEIRESCKDTPILLVGTKLDLRQDAERKGLFPVPGGLTEAKDNGEGNGTGNGSSNDFISALKGEILADSIGAVAYVECSAITQEGLSHVVDKSLDAWANYQKAQAPRGSVCPCTIL